MKKVAIVIVTFNRLKLLKECISSIRHQSFLDFSIIVVNNGSTDNTKEWLDNQEDIITIHQKNTGGAGGFFSGLKYAAEKNYPFCWLMDDDVICSENALDELLRAYQVKEKIGFVCSKVQGIDGCPMNIPSVDTTPTKNGYPCYDELIHYNMIKVKMATFVSVFFSTKIIHEIGLPYKEYFIWGDDFEYTRRISTKYESYLACNSIVTHKRGTQGNLSFDKETDPNRLNNYYYFFRNNWFNMIKYELNQPKKYNLFSHIILQILWGTTLFFKGQFHRSYIIFKALLALPFFKPEVIFPNKT